MSGDEEHGPALDVIKPGRKVALSQTEDFDSCFERASSSTSPLTTVRVFDGVYYLDNVLTEEECSKLCKVADDHQSLSFWSPAGRDDESIRRYRDADTIEVDGRNIADNMWKRVQTAVDESLAIAVDDDEADPNYERELIGHWEPSALNHDLLFARYPSGGAFAPHTDGRAIHDFNTRSFYSVIVFLNTIPVGSGGGTRFYVNDAVKQLKSQVNADGKVHWTTDPSLVTANVDAVAGRLLIFHQALVHEGVPPLSPHLKYIIRSDVMMKRNPAVCDSERDREAYRIFKQAEDLAEAGDVAASMPLFRRAFKLSPQMAQIMGQA